MADLQSVQTNRGDAQQPQNFASETYRVIEQRAKPRLKTGPIVGMGSWAGRAPERINVCIKAEDSPTFSIAQKIATTMNDGINKVNFTSCKDAGPNDIIIIRGPN